MKILIVAATAFEIRPITDKLPLLSRENEFLSTHLFKHAIVDILIPGVGMTHTAFHLGRQLSLQNYQVAINAGIAGAYDRRLKLGTVIHVTEDCISEMGAEDTGRFLTFFDLGLMDPEAFPYSGGRLVNDHYPRLETLKRIPPVKGNTVNHIHATPESIARIRTTFPADVETLEGAAFLYGCLLEKVPCLQIRSISNHVEERDKTRWNVELALKNLNKTLELIFNELVI